MKALSYIFLALVSIGVYGQAQPEKQYTESFDRDNCHFVNSTIHPYLFLRPGYQVTLRGMEGKDTAEVVMTVLTDTKVIGTTETRVIEEREFVKGKLVEV